MKPEGSKILVISLAAAHRSALESAVIHSAPVAAANQMLQFLVAVLR